MRNVKRKVKIMLYDLLQSIAFGVYALLLYLVFVLVRQLLQAKKKFRFFVISNRFNVYNPLIICYFHFKISIISKHIYLFNLNSAKFNSSKSTLHAHTKSLQLGARSLSLK